MCIGMGVRAFIVDDDDVVAFFFSFSTLHIAHCSNRERGGERGRNLAYRPCFFVLIWLVG